MLAPIRGFAVFLILLFTTIGIEGFEYLVFAQQHPPGYCRSTFKQKCIESKMQENFTIHGLWPAAKDETLQHCDKRKFDVKEVQSIRSRLEKAWPSFKTNDPTVFWAHEWRKHGTCGSTSSGLSGILDYFNTTLLLHDRYDILGLLKNDGIVPSTKTPYKINHMRRALSKEIRGNVQFTCDKAEGYDYPILTEVRLCLGEDLRVVDCPSKKERCGRDLIFFLPLKNSGSSGTSLGNLVFMSVIGLTILHRFLMT